jgi:hypothetical protein
LFGPRAFLLLALMAAPACHPPPPLPPPPPEPLVCTQIACDDQLVLELRRGDGLAPAFSVAVTVEGKTVSCPAPGPGEVRTCGEVTSTIAGNDPALQLIQVRGAPPAIEVEARAGDQVLEKRRFAPAYQTRQPNGPHCPPVCRQATEAWRPGA